MGRTLLVLALVACAAVPVGAAGPKTVYERVLAQEQSLRLSRRPSPLSQIRKVIAAYEVVARRYPTSGYADNALFQAAALSLAAHRIYGSSMDRETATRMLEWLIDEYPHSSLITKARQMLRRAKPPERTPALRAASGPAATASPLTVVTHTSPAPPPAPPPTRPSNATSGASAPSPSPASVARPVTLKQVTRTELSGLVRVTLEFDGDVTFQQEKLDGPARLYFDFDRTTTAPGLQDAAFSYEDESVRHIRLGRPKPDMTRLVIDLAGVERYSVFELYNPYRLTIDLQRSAARAPAPLVARRVVEPTAKTAPRLSSANVPKDLDMLPRVPLRPLPHPLADAPRVTSSRPVSAEIARAMRVRPVRGNRRGFPISTDVALAEPIAIAVTAQVAPLLVPKPLAASRRGLALNAPAKRAPKPTAVTARIRADEAAQAEAESGAVTAATPAGAATALKAATTKSTLPAPTAPAANTAGGFSLARQLGLGVARIVIDPGHGGHDPGALGSKVNESDVVLDVALRLEKLLKGEPGFEVLMTRRTDVFIPLEERTAYANRHQADLFLSIHANSSRNKQASGVETYFLNFASNPEAEAVAARENAGAAHTMNHLPEIVRAIALNNKLDESRDFARMVQESMVGRLKTQNAAMKDLGVKQAPFVVLIGAGMPSVLAEIAFVSHQQEGNLLKTGAYRQRVAEALFDAVKTYQRSLKNMGTVAATAGVNDRD